MHILTNDLCTYVYDLFQVKWELLHLIGANCICLCRSGYGMQTWKMKASQQNYSYNHRASSSLTASFLVNHSSNILCSLVGPPHRHVCLISSYVMNINFDLLLNILNLMNLHVNKQLCTRPNSSHIRHRKAGSSNALIFKPRRS